MVLVKKRIDEVDDRLYVETNKSHKITDVSPAFYKEFNINEGELIGKSIYTIVSRHTNFGKNKVIFGKLFGYSCLLRMKNLEDKKIYHILLSEQNIDYIELISFINSIEAKKYKKKSIKQNRYSFDDIIGQSPAIQRVKELASKIATNNSTVLLTGESGTGKELFAQAIHELSTRKNQSFIAVNCVAIPDELFESELFGYEAGAFSGAKQEGKPGKIELAQNGTLFLDEISELSYQSQGKLLRVLQEREVERLGGTTSKKVDIRIIAATNRDLKTLVENGKFRQDLYYRLYVFDLQIPPLRVRKEDILPLTYSFIEFYNNKFDKEVTYIDSGLEDWLLTYEWPGNIRELKACIERGMNIVDNDTLTLKNLYLPSNNKSSMPVSLMQENMEFLSLHAAVENAEISIIKQALDDANGDRTIAAQKLKISVASLYRKISKYKLK
ncbi:sigma-54 interaction domain-containing protein [Oceanobacillus senegalensis]|uniref:sigma-54 interaction domain-containing protein n=1 Tax=Oceanobacillus senegalensis TaxID=1936063 RepID=UPI000A312282|nr:sigma 54-interacting transcriptional regulator [Oceanobacillus senegalensis]